MYRFYCIVLLLFVTAPAFSKETDLKKDKSLIKTQHKYSEISKLEKDIEEQINKLNKLDTSVNKTTSNQIIIKNDIKKQIKRLNELHTSINKTTSNQIILKNDIIKLVDKLENKSLDESNLNIKVETPFDYKSIMTPLITILVVIGGTIISVVTISKKTKESVHAFDETIKTQLTLSEVHLKAEVLSRNRQKWIDNLRSEISHFLAKLHEYDHHITFGKSLKISEMINIISKLREHEAKIKLLINPKEKDHQQLVKLIESSIRLASTEERTVFEDGIDQVIIETSQTILKREWVRVKDLD